MYRIKAGNPGYLVVFNPTEINQRANITSDSLPQQLTVVTASDNYNVTNIGQKYVYKFYLIQHTTLTYTSYHYRAGQRIAVDDLELSPYSTIILTYVSKKTE